MKASDFCRSSGANWETISEHTTHLLLFSLEMTAKGKIVALDRFPRKELYEQVRQATRKHGTALMICFGGNGRSEGFSAMTRKAKNRKRFVKELGEFMEKYDLDGVDYNWEYPGYRFGQGYLAESEVKADYEGLSKLVFETRQMYVDKGWANKAITMAYYPDSRQEQLLRDHGIAEQADLLHMMSYDQGGTHHSSLEYGRKSADQGKGILPAQQLTMGVPFYGRHSRSGEWTTYEDLVQKHWPLNPALDAVDVPGGASIGFNGVTTMSLKTNHTLQEGLAGVMIWEVGQDCRLQPVVHGSTTHVRTCPEDEASLLLAISRTLAAAKRVRMRMPGWRTGVDPTEL
ncbi:Probable chitinase 2 [Durusdinium trenchii]|uniref:Probable chitinase 2 n=1 Tax=Durusdinium trenchii TaxID=1381693 RepID=A0ABP0JXY1_9DINO